MSKKVLGVFAVIVVLVLSLTALVACNSYEWSSIGGGNPSEASVSNGGYFVRQGNYAYFINGYVGSVTENEWGSVLKQGIVRAELNADGTINNNTAKQLVPVNIYNSSANGGFAIFGEWLYYATPNLDKDRTGTASTTDTDFMRTKIDGSVTQRIGTISSRSAEYIFTPSRVLYYLNNTISYIDFSGMDTKKSSDNAKGASSGNIADNVSSVVWNYDSSYVVGQGADISDYLFYTQTVTGDDSYKNYNNLYAVRYDGSDRRLIATETSYLAEGEEAVNNPQKVFKYALVDSYLESDGTTVTIYYTKSFYKYTDGTGADTIVGLFCNKFSVDGGFDVSAEKRLNALASSTTMYPLGYEDGALAYNKDSVYCWYNGSNADNPIQVSGASQTVRYVKDGFAYISASSSASALYRINYKSVSNIQTVFTETMVVDWLALDFDGDNFYFFASDDYNYLHYINLSTFDYTIEDAESTFVGIMTEADAKAKAEAEAEKEEE